MAPEVTTTPPSVSWAQNKSNVFLTFNIECVNPVVKIETDSVYFRGKNNVNKQDYEIKIPLFGKIIPEESKQENKTRNVEVILVKENKYGHFWSTLTSDKKKHHWLKTDFNRWMDEEDSEEDSEGCDDGFPVSKFKPLNIGNHNHNEGDEEWTSDDNEGDEEWTSEEEEKGEQAPAQDKERAEK